MNYVESFLFPAILALSVLLMVCAAMRLMKRNDEPARRFLRACWMVLGLGLACCAVLVVLRVLVMGQLDAADLRDLRDTGIRLTFVVAILGIVGTMIRGQQTAGSALKRQGDNAE